ncbi:hypothetical protein L3i22_065460 [Actinoplanes sp. L3-i22]|nr:hypothetical protein L3i22_065460 [Actinoplanes sp. L3-i22]
MCRYSSIVYKVHYVCVPCRRSSKLPWDGVTHPCPRCRVPMAYAGHDFAAPRRRNTSAWIAVAAVLTAGLRYDGFETCGCGRDPKFRPRTSARSACDASWPPATASRSQTCCPPAIPTPRSDRHRPIGGRSGCRPEGAMIDAWMIAAHTRPSTLCL